MIEILIVDDSVAKVEAIEGFLHGLALGETEMRVVAVGDIYSATTHLLSSQVDLLILDIKVPMRPGEPPRRDGGVTLLRAILTRPQLKRPAHIVGVTSFDELQLEYGPDFASDMWSVIHHDPASTEWLEQLGRRVVHILTAQGNSVGEYFTDLCVLTAMHSIELEAVLSLPGSWSIMRQDGDGTFYHRGKFEGSRKTLDVVVAAANEVGMPAAAALAMKMILTFRPRHIAMVGIAAGVGAGFGDILVADQAWDYGSGKIREEEQGGGSIFLPAPQALPLEQPLKACLQMFALDRTIPRHIFAEWDGAAVSAPPVVHIGPVASGAAVLSDAAMIERIRSHNRKVIGVEMEVYGLFAATRLAPAPRPLAFAIKSVCDFGDREKTDEYQRYAAYTSARYLHAFAAEYL